MDAVIEAAFAEIVRRNKIRESRICGTHTWNIPARVVLELESCKRARHGLTLARCEEERDHYRMGWQGAYREARRLIERKLPG